MSASSSSSSSKQTYSDLAQILKRMLMAENSTLYGSSDISTLEQLIEMNGGDLMASFSMVHGRDPTPSKVNISEITDQYYKEKSSKSTTGSSSVNTGRVNTNNLNLSSSEIMIEEDEDTNNGNGKQASSSNGNTSTLPNPHDDTTTQEQSPSQPKKALPLSMQMKVRTLRLRLRETPMANQFEKKDDHVLAELLEDHNEDVNTTLEFILSKNNNGGTNDPVVASSSNGGTDVQNTDKIVIHDVHDNLDDESSSDISVDDPLNLIYNEDKTKRRHSALTLDMQLKIRSVKMKLKDSKNIQNVEDSTLLNLLQLNDNDVQQTVDYLKECDASTLLDNGGAPPPKALYVAPTTWDKNPSIPIPVEEIEKLKQEGRNIVNINQLPNDSLEHILEYLDKRNNLQMSAVNQYFNKCASSDYFWTSKGQKGRNGLIEPYEVDQYNVFTKNHTYFGKWKLARMDNLFYTKLHQVPVFMQEKLDKINQDMTTVQLQDQQPITNNDEEMIQPSFKSKYAKYKKEQLVQQRVMEIENNIIQNKQNDISNRDYEQQDSITRAWIGFIVVAIVSAVIGLILIPLSMDEYIPNDIGTYYWLFSWLSIGIVTVPYFYLMIARHSHLYEFYPAWTSKQLGDFRIEYTTQTLILFSSTWMWIPYIWLVGGLKYAIFPDLPILSYIAIPAYVWCLLSYMCGIPSLKSSLQMSAKEIAGFYVSTIMYGFLLAFSVLFIILLFAKIDGLEYALNIPWSLIFIPLYAAVGCLPLGFLLVPMIVFIINKEFWAGLGTGCGFGFVLFLIVSPIYIVAPLIGAVLDSFILQTVFPFVAVFSIAYGLGLIILSVVACVACFFFVCFALGRDD
ncbi:hypothetical protein C9374_001665 [Naegleria lovaniensis]|uniref:F-box domain-containing protein n=1 Tax=Naegleria lovaniensis TaxID=51637 RepID=A0AA88GVZ1_NAELO|nr:uncharacterized protein C9374_001665 [Naegleria lovaniensis]KAG2387333.1 hypothetical protein C9374_001665 [Naegleria lovaniensis]